MTDKTDKPKDKKKGTNKSLEVQDGKVGGKSSFKGRK